MSAIGGQKMFQPRIKCKQAWPAQQINRTGYGNWVYLPTIFAVFFEGLAQFEVAFTWANRRDYELYEVVNYCSQLTGRSPSTCRQYVELHLGFIHKCHATTFFV